MSAITRNISKSIYRILVVIILTVVSQVGGVIYLIHVALMKALGITRWWKRWLSFAIVYTLIVFLIVPPLAKFNNRVPLPVMAAKKTHVRPHSFYLSLTCRHYVRPELKEMILEVAEEMQEEYPGLKIEYLDANFPLLKEFRMYPHIKHDDGRKLDIGYIRMKPNGEYAYKYNSAFGYGYSIKPLPGETNKPKECADKGAWQYNIIEKYVPDQIWRGHTFPVEENRALISKITSHPAVRYLVMEPHLTERVGLTEVENIGSLGCWAIRHDDHMHVVGQRDLND